MTDTPTPLEEMVGFVLGRDDGGVLPLWHWLATADKVNIVSDTAGGLITRYKVQATFHSWRGASAFVAHGRGDTLAEAVEMAMDDKKENYR